MDDRIFQHNIQWFQAGKKPTVLGLHISILLLIPLNLFFFHWKWLLLTCAWVIVDIWLGLNGLTLKAAVKRIRLFARAGFRTVVNRRAYQKIKRGI